MILSSTIVIFAIIYLTEALNKCCPEGQHFDETISCVDSSNDTHIWLPSHLNLTSLTINFGETPCDLHMAKYRSEFNLTSEGNVFVREQENEWVKYKEDSFCIDNIIIEEDVYDLVYVCPCVEYLCVWKCCNQGKHLKTDAFDTKYCSNFEDKTQEDWSFDLLNGTVQDMHYTMNRLHDCNSKNKSVNYLYGNFKLQSDGYLYSEVDGLIHPNDYCGDFIKHGEEMKATVLACLDPMEVRFASTDYVYMAMWFLGAFLLLTTTALYVWLPEMGGLNRWLVALHSGSLLVAYVTSASQNFGFNELKSVPCKATGYVMQFSFLAAFFWLNVMCLDMSWTFSGLRPPSGSQRERDRSKFIWYSVYAWGGSLAITGITLIVEHTVAYGTPFKPNVGTIKCWFKDAEALWIFFYGPMAILLLMNLALFVYTSYRIVVLRRGTATLHQGDSARHGGSNPTNRDKQRYILYAKLFSLMGVTWLTEIISWAVGGPDYIWYVTDAINLLRAVFIFIIFCWKPRVWKVIKKRISCVKKCEEVICAVCCGKKSIDCPEDPKTSSTNSQRQTCSIKMDPIGTRLP